MLERSRLKLCFFTYLIIFVCNYSSGQAVRHAYRFNGNLKASEPDCGPDLVQSKAPGLCFAGNVPGAFITDSLPVCGSKRTLYHTNLHWGLMYPNANSNISTTYTINMYVKVTAWGPATWVRIIDFFPNSSYDRGIYFKLNSAGKFCLDFWPNGVLMPCPYFDLSTYYLLSFTRNGTTGRIDVYVNGVLFTSYNDQSGDFVARTGMPIYIFRDDQYIACESGEANFAYLSFTNSYSSQADITSVYNNICTISKINTVDFNFNPSAICSPGQNTTVTYTGNITLPATGYFFNWNWDGGTVVSGSGIGPYVVNWNSAGIKNVTLTITGGNCTTPVTNTIPVSVGGANIQQSIQPATCTSNGIITLTDTGSTGSYTYSIDGVNYQNSPSLQVPPGSYTVYAKDGNNCLVKMQALVLLTDNLAVQTRADTTVCQRGPVKLSTVSNASSFSWSPAAGLDNPSIKEPFANPANTTQYIVTATAGNCTRKDTVSIIVSPPITVVANASAILCTTNSPGTITLTAGGGTPPYQYSIDGINFQNSNVFQAPAGSYKMTIKDALTCFITTDVTVRNTDDLILQTRSDTNVCAGQPVKLFTNSNALTFSWLPATGLDDATAKEPVAVSMQTTSYVVTATSGSCTKKDTVVVNVSPPMQTSLTIEKASCSGNGRISLVTTGGTAPYQYSLDGAAFQNVNSFAVPRGPHSFVVRDAKNCTITASATVEASDNIFLQTRSDTVVCEGQPVQLFTNTNATAFSWQPVSGLSRGDIKDPVAKPAVTTDYIITATDGNCIKKDTVTVTVNPRIQVIATPDTMVVAGIPFQLFAYSPQLAGSAGASYLWTPATGLSNDKIPNPVSVLNTDQVYLVEAQSSLGCKGSASVHISIIKEFNIYVPSGFTPNQDGLNDVFKPVYAGISSLNYFKVFNRWGKQVYATTTQAGGWDGMFAGVAQPSGVYVWIVKGITQQGKIISKKGTILLIR